MNLLARIGPPLGLFVAAMATRLVSWHSVFQRTGVHPNGHDAYYHLRRIRYSIEHFPDVLNVDPLMNHPHGGQPIWSPAFDWLIAATLAPVPGIEQAEVFERLVVWVPAVLGALTVVMLYFIALHFYSRSVAILAAAILSVLPGHTLYSRLGNVDHHVLVAMSATLMLALTMKLLSDAPTSSRDADRLWLSAGLGASMAATVLVWPGALLHVGILQVALIVRLLSASDLTLAIGWARRFAWAHFVACLVVYPFSAGNEWVLWGPFSPVVLSNFQPLYLFAAATVFAALALLWRVGIGAATPGQRLASAIGLGALVLVGVFGAVPELAAGIGDALSWFAKDEEFQSTVSESTPLFGAEVGTTHATMLLSRFVLIAPVMIAYLGWRNRNRPEQLVLIGWSSAFLAASGVQWRFVNTYSIAHSLLIALCVVAVHDSIAPRLTNRPRRFTALGALGACLVFALLPAVRSYDLHFENVLRSLRGAPTPPRGTLRDTAFLTEAAKFLRDHSPPIEDAPYSVLGPWGAGHVLKYVAERPVVQDNFGDDVAPENFRLAEDYFAAPNEGEAIATAETLGARYVLVRPVGSGHSRGYSRDSQFVRLYVARGTSHALSAREDASASILPPLERHRLIYQSAPKTARGRAPFATLFEIVRGAQVVGRAEPGTLVTARLTVNPDFGARFEYENQTTTNEDGIYRLRLPYSNQSLSQNVRIGASYTMTIRGGAVRGGADMTERRLVVSERAVLEGEVVDGPDFSSEPGIDREWPGLQPSP